jgi:predicted MPP superfamily phosphohydrolase
MPSWGRFLVFVAVIGGLSALVHYYVWTRLVRAAVPPPGWARAVTLVILVMGIAMPLSMPVARLLPRNVALPVAFVIYTWMGILLFLFLGSLLGDLVRVGVAVADRLKGAEVDRDRRALLGRGIAAITAIAAASVAGFGIVSARGPIAIKQVKVKLAKLPAAMHGLTIAQITDVHIGPTIGRDFIVSVVERVNALQADVVVITGDLVDGSVAELREHAAPLAQLRARHGVFFVTGNHEYYSGVDEWLVELRRLGIRPLRNERVTIEHEGAALDLAGVDDFNARGGGHGPDLPRALAGRDPERALVLLAHQPRAIVEAAQHGVGLQLSGHTHGGQLWPWTYLVFLQQPYVAGLHRHGDAQIYVSRGTGYWGPPMRVGAPAEITHLVLESPTPA